MNSIERAPFLVDLSLETCWNFRFARHLGPLNSFVRRQNLRQFSFLFVDFWRILKICPKSTVENLVESLSEKNALKCASELVSILVRPNSKFDAPIFLLKSTLENFVRNSNFDEKNFDLIREILLFVPFPIVRTFFGEIFFDVFPRRIAEKIFAPPKQSFSVEEKRKIEKIAKNFSFPTTNDEPKIKTEEKRIPTFAPRKIEEKQNFPIVEPIQNFDFSPFDFVEKIRREKFLCAFSFDSQSEIFTERLKSIVGRSLDRLSKELYNNDLHFVLELIQNADDNQYDQQPEILFLIQDESIDIFNNERGFLPENIEALCDLGKSTKQKHQTGFIGQKGLPILRYVSFLFCSTFFELLGIGFKSVFTVRSVNKSFSLIHNYSLFVFTAIVIRSLSYTIL